MGTVGSDNPVKWAGGKRDKLDDLAAPAMLALFAEARDVCLPGVPLAAPIGFCFNGDPWNTTGWKVGDQRERDEAIAAIGTSEIATNQCEVNVMFHNEPIVTHGQNAGIPMTAYLPLAKGAASSGCELERIAAKYGATAAQIALSWLLGKGHIAIPSSSNTTRIEQNFRAADISLSPGDTQALDQMNGDRRVSPPWAPDWDIAA